MREVRGAMKQFVSLICLCLLLLLSACAASTSTAQTPEPAEEAVTAAENPQAPEEKPAESAQEREPDETVPDAAQEQNPEETEQVRVLPDGVYSVDFKTDSSMFQASEACGRKGVLTVQDGVQTLHVSLQSKKIVNLYPGTAEQAQQSGAVWLEPTTDTVTYSDGLSEEVFGFDVPVASVGAEFDLALVGTKGTWYDHTVSVENPIPQQGSYLCAVSLSGGSGRASVSSPTELVSDGENLLATIVWSSSHYEYMIVDDVQYDPVQQEGNSTFQIPVKLDQELAVSACTTAMSTPHVVEYSLLFDSATLTRN